MKMEAYDYDNNYTGTGLCNRDDDNYVGAQLATLYYFMFVFSILGNGLVLVIIHRFEKLTTVTNILLLNLVLSSVIFMSSLPFLGVYMQLSTWIFGKVMCKIVGSVYYLGFYSSVLFLALLTFDRHLAVVYSLRMSHVRNRSYAVISCGVVWLVSGLACIRPMILHTASFYPLDNKTYYCDEDLSDRPNINVDLLIASEPYLQLLFLIFPLVVIIYCYVRIAITVMSSKIVTKFKTVRLIFVIVLLFFICWTPYNIVKLMHDKVTDCEEGKRLGYALHFTRMMTYIYFCISPIFYTFVGKKFQNYFRQLLVKRFPSLRHYVAVSQHSDINMSTKSTRNVL
ncbi:C-C chemokine receptor type 3-like [Acanthochromis polyacanthus]|uniref:C-C chemokine receptor type 3-like n=1 Tax=Acanthochromis polyacanthus TaxID=80966 RepID=A0A3Q1F581_9TELE|nr:C-C chemokine receptor type 3-like [Acanthochromis polyacanthus]